MGPGVVTDIAARPTRVAGPRAVRSRPVLAWTRNRAHGYKPFRTGQRACIARQFALHEAVLTLGLILHRYDLIPEDGYQLRISESITLKPRGFRLAMRKRPASSRLLALDTELSRRSA